MPFITEELWAHMVELGVETREPALPQPMAGARRARRCEADEEIGWLVKLISEIRSVRTEMNVPAGAKIPLVLVGASKVDRARVSRHNDETFKRLARLDAIDFAKSAPKGAAQIVPGRRRRPCRSPASSTWPRKNDASRRKSRAR